MLGGIGAGPLGHGAGWQTPATFGTEASRALLVMKACTASASEVVIRDRRGGRLGSLRSPLYLARSVRAGIGVRRAPIVLACLPSFLLSTWR